MGSVGRDQRCINVSIIDDYLKEKEEIFYIQAAVVSPVVGMRFGGALNSTTGHMSVRIIDNDGKTPSVNSCVAMYAIYGSAIERAVILFT